MLWRNTAICVFAAAAFAGCVPNSVTISLGGGHDELRTTTVIEDENAGDAVVAMIDVTGMIADAPRAQLIGESPGMVSYVVRRLSEAAQREDVKAVILRINSPGGTVTASDILYHEITRFRERTGKPVIASMGEVAASGAYYISLAADEIIAQPTTITGSIGVIFPTMNFSKGLDRLGIQALLVTSGKNKAMADPFTPPEEDDYKILQAMVDQFYGRYRGLVLKRRPNLDPDVIDTVTDGRIITGMDAAAVGLVDATGGVRDAFARAKELAGVESATLIRYYVGQAGPKTAYASASADGAVSQSSAREAPSLIELTIGSGLGSHLSPMAYYIWGPGLF